jgi:predicted PurR-regulated permease PerM
MHTSSEPDLALEKRLSARLLDVLIRAGLVAALVVLCFQIFSPFLTLMVWAMILAVTIYPLHQALARKLRGKQGLAATLVVIVGSVLIITPSALLINSLGDSVHDLVDAVQQDTLQIPPPRNGVAEWPIVGPQLHEVWSKAHADLPAFVHSMQPKIGDLTKKALSMVASLGVEVLLFLAAFIIAGILMAFGASAERISCAIFNRITTRGQGEQFVKLATATIRAVAQGVIGVAFIQAIIIGIALMIAGVPFAGVLAVITLVLGIAQVPALLITVPTIAYIWSSGDYSTGAATTHTIILLIAGMADNVLKPLMLGRGVDVPMPVILFGALGGMATGGILGMFVGATVLTLGYQIFMHWVDTNPDSIAVATNDIVNRPGTPSLE